MSRKKLRNRLESLFAGLEPDGEGLLPSSEGEPAAENSPVASPAPHLLHEQSWPDAVEGESIPPLSAKENGRQNVARGEGLQPVEGLLPGEIFQQSNRREPTTVHGYRAAEDGIFPAVSLLSSAGPRPTEPAGSEDSNPSLLTLTVPLRDGRSNLMVEILDGQSSRRWSEDEALLVEQVADQLTLALQNAELFSQTQQALSEMAALYQASGELNAAQNYDSILDTLRQFTLLGEFDTHVSLNLFDSPWTSGEIPEWTTAISRWTRLPSSALQDRYPLRSFSFAQAVLESGVPLMIEDVQADPRLDAYSKAFFTQNFRARSLLFVPLRVGSLWLGFIYGASSQPAHFAETAIIRLTMLSNQAAIAVQNLHSLQLAEQRAREAHQRSQELELVNQIVTRISATLDLRASLDVIARELGEALSVQVGIALLNEERQVLVLAASYSPNPDIPAMIGVELPLEGNPSSQHVFRTRQTLVVDDPQNSPLTAPIHKELRQRGMYSLLIVPLVAGGKVIGTVGLDILEPERRFTPEEIRLAESIVLQGSAAIHNARLFAQTQSALAETERLYQGSAEISAAHTYEAILEALARHTALSAAGCTVTIDVFDRPWAWTASGPGDQRPETITVLVRRPAEGLEAGLVQTWRTVYLLADLPALAGLLRADSPVVIADVAADPRLDDGLRTLLARSFQARSAVFLPLVVGGQWIGYINALFLQTVQFSQAELRMLRGLTVQAAVAIQNLRLFAEAQRRARQLQTAAEVARDASSTLAQEDLLNQSVELICERFGYYHASIFLLDEDGRYAVVRASTGKAGAEMMRMEHRLPVGSQSIVGAVTAAGRPRVANDVTLDPTHRPNPLLPLTRAELGIPLKIGSRVIGALDVQSTEPGAFTADDVSVLQILADQIAVAVDNAVAYELAQKAVEEMRELDRLKSQFLANMSHELRTPLNSIIGFSRVILKGIDGPINELQQQDLTAIYNSGQHLLGLINDVLDLSKIEAGKMELAFEEGVNVADLITSVMSTAVGLLKDKPVKLYRNVSADLPAVRADPMKVRQVLLNLLSNAAKFTEQGSITVDAATQVDVNGQEVVLVKVIDTGQGIAPEDQEKLFKPFSQVDGSLTRRTGGTGLGLSICQRLIDMHGGQIGVESQVGQGSTFYFTLPVTKPEPASEEVDSEQTQSDNRPVILAIDDDNNVIDLYERYLADHGFRVVALSDPGLAVQRALELEPSVITLDVMMPGRDGWQVLQDLKNHPQTQHIPVILCTILEEQERGFSLGADDYLMKPILEEDLVQSVKRLAGDQDRFRSS